MMKKFQLEGYREKLLEMNRKIFTKYHKHYFTGNDNEYVCMSNGALSQGQGLCCHWYEFIMTFLVEGVFFPKGVVTRGVHEKVKNFLWDSNLYWFNMNGGELEYNPLHPIIALYEIFKENEKEGKYEE